MDDWRLRTESVCVREIRGSGTHTIRWRYSKNGSGSAGEDCVWVDYVRWSGTMPDAGPWGQIEYVYDPSGRRIEKKVDGDTELKFLYDGDHIIAEYDANDTLLRKYVHGPCIDEPICLIESSGDYAGTQYYHYDALGSVVAMTDASGDAVQLYEYSIYGQVAASDPNHPNRFMFTGREFDKDTGLYYYRARYYHPEIGRFLQTDPTGYGDGINWYRYCANNPTNFIDPSGLVAIAFYDGGDIGDGDGDGNSDWKIANGDDLKEEADDFNIYEAGLTVELAFDLRTAETLGMSHTEYLIWVLETWSDMGGLSPITETYIFDHGSESGLQIGDEGLEFSGIGADGTLTWGEDFIDFCQGLKDNTNPDTVIHFRGCNMGAVNSISGSRSLLTALATYTGRKVTGCEGGITLSPFAHLFEMAGPDYRFGASVYQAEVKDDGTVDVSYYWELKYITVPTGYGLTVTIPDYYGQPY